MRTLLRFVRSPRTAAACILATAAVAACSSTSEPLPRSSGGSRARLAYVTHGAQPALYVAWSDSTGAARVHFANVADSIAGNGADLPVDDAHLLGLDSPRWDPNSVLTRVAVVATAAYDQSEIVVVDVDAGTMQVASPNTQIIGSAPEWSGNGTRLAYTMSTLPGFGGLDLFMTDLPTHTVHRLTTGARAANAAVRWSADGNSVYFSRTTGTTSGLPSNWLSDVLRVDVASGASQTLASGIIGRVVAIAKDGTHVLVARSTGTGSTALSALYDVTLAGGERGVLTNADVVDAHYVSPADDRIVVTAASGASGTTDYTNAVLDLSRNAITALPGVTGTADIDLSYIIAVLSDAAPAWRR